MSQMLERKPRVVVVEDDGENRRALSELLAAEGFEPFPYACGEEAWSAIASEQVRPDVVVADVRMPGLDGMALLHRIKARFPALPVILISAFADEQVWSEGLQAGALDVFPKPIRGASLVRALRDAAGAARG
jgi:two-component system C4-dicarboxylate transport response regulator DctD